VTNLIQNAMKFTRAGGRVSVTASRNAARAHIAVEDECGGLPDLDEHELFDSFERHGTETTGLGLGLKISREAVKVDGGEIRVRNLPGKGCVFTIELPVTTA
jgi:signal transduction histidine kinase